MSVSGSSIGETSASPSATWKRSRCANACQRCKAKKLRCTKDESATECLPCTKSHTRCVFEVEKTQPFTGRERQRLERKIRDLETAVARYEQAKQDVSVGDAGVLGLMTPIRGTMSTSQPDPLPLPDHLGLPIFQRVHIHILSRYTFLQWDDLRDWFDDRSAICVEGTTRHVEAYFVWMITAIGAQLDPKLAQAPPRAYLQAAWKHMPAVMQRHDLSSLEALLLACFYSFRSNDFIPHWMLAGHAMRCCIDRNLHRRNAFSAIGRPEMVYESERRKRIFWTAYAFDRLVAFSRDRPFSISDQDIDIDLPTNVDSEERSAEAILEAQATNGRLTTLTSSIQSVKLYQILSRVYSAFHVVSALPPPIDATVAFLAELGQWRSNIPPVTPEGVGIPSNVWEMRYLRYVLYTLRPSIFEADLSDNRLTLCASAAAEACELAKVVYQEQTMESSLSPRQCFVHGITLLHCFRLSPNVISRRVATRAVRACSTTLAVLSQHVPESKQLSELFDHLADEVESGEATATTAETLKQILRGETQLPLGGPFASVTYPSLSPHATSSTATQMLQMPNSGLVGSTPFFGSPIDPGLPVGGINSTLQPTTPMFDAWIDWCNVSQQEYGQ